MVANPGNVQLIFLGVNGTNLGLRIQDIEIKSQQYVKLLGVEIDSKLRFDSHIKNICTIASGKIKCLQRIGNYIDIKQATLLVNAFILSGFGYCPIIWMFCNRTLSSLIDKVQKRCLRIIIGDYELSLPHLLGMTGFHSIHTKHLHFLLVEVFKSLHRLNPFFMQEYFRSKSVQI